jgi:hypothetical protein
MEYIIKPCPALAEFGYETPIRADGLGEPGRITSQIIKLLIEADLVIADLTWNNANVYYELSLRHAIGGRAIHMALADTNVSFDLRDNRTISYTLHCRVAETARDELSKQIRRVHEAGYRPMNPILETVDIIELQRSSDPKDQVLGQLLSSFETLTSEIRSAVRSLQTDSKLTRWLPAGDPPSITNNPLMDLLRRSGNATVDGPANPAPSILPKST